jgi:hypothetical protein
MINLELRNEWLRLAAEALKCIQVLPEPDRTKTQKVIDTIIDLLNNNSEPQTWDFSLLAYGATLSKEYDCEPYFSELEPVYYLFNELLLAS